MAFGLFWLVWILWETLRLGVGGLDAGDASPQMTPPPNEAGGLPTRSSARCVMVALATFVGTPIGIMAGIYLAEYDPQGLAGATSRASSTTSCCRRRRS